MDNLLIEDTVQKIAVEKFGEQAADFLGIDKKLISVANLELKDLSIIIRSDDFLFNAENDEFVHVEFQSTFTKEDLIRFHHADMRIFEKTQRNITTFVVFSSNITVVETVLRYGCCTYKIRPIYLSNYDGDQYLAILEEKIKSRDALEDKDILILTLTPFMKSRLPIDALVEKSLILALSLEDKESSRTAIVLLSAFSEKFGSEIIKNKVRENVKITEIS
jgi:hypothetical protein